MERQEISRLLAQHAEELKSFSVRALSLFGSSARGEARADSDVDLVVELDRPIGLFRFARLQRFLEEILARKVDLVPSDSIRPQLREAILREAVRVA
jgi:uncharacterized protein